MGSEVASSTDFAPGRSMTDRARALPLSSFIYGQNPNNSHGARYFGEKDFLFMADKLQQANGVQVYYSTCFPSV